MILILFGKKPPKIHKNVNALITLYYQKWPTNSAILTPTLFWGQKPNIVRVNALRTFSPKITTDYNMILTPMMKKWFLASWYCNVGQISIIFRLYWFVGVNVV